MNECCIRNLTKAKMLFASALWSESVEVSYVNLRAAVIGTGFVGRAHIEALRRLGISIQGVLENSVTRTQEACRALGITRAYTSLEELTGDRSVGCAHMHTQPSPLSADAIGSAGWQACDLREAARDEYRRDGRTGKPGAEARTGRSRKLQPALLSAVPGGACSGTAGRHRRATPCLW